MTVRHGVFIDFDGTFAVRGAAPAAHGEAVRRARANGHAVVLSTGRAASIVAPEVAALFDGVIASAGAHVRLDQDVLCDHRVPAPIARRAVEVLTHHDVTFLLEAPEALWCSRRSAERVSARMQPVRSLQRSAHELMLSASGDTAVIGNGPQDILDALRVSEDLASCSFAKISLWDSPVPVEQLASEISPEVGALPNSIAEDSTASGELHLRALDKAGGMRQVCEHLGIDLSASIALGDGLNDLGMLRAAGTAVAIAGGHEQVLAGADLTVPPPQEHGIVTAFERLGLI